MAGHEYLSVPPKLKNEIEGSMGSAMFSQLKDLIIESNPRPEEIANGIIRVKEGESISSLSRLFRSWSQNRVPWRAMGDLIGLVSPELKVSFLEAMGREVEEKRRSDRAAEQFLLDRPHVDATRHSNTLSTAPSSLSYQASVIPTPSRNPHQRGSYCPNGFFGESSGMCSGCSRSVSQDSSFCSSCGSPVVVSRSVSMISGSTSASLGYMEAIREIGQQSSTPSSDILLEAYLTDVSTSHVHPPKVMSIEEKKKRHSIIVSYLSESFSEKQVGGLVTSMVLQEILPGKMRHTRDILDVLMELDSRAFIAPGQYNSLYKFLVSLSMGEVAQGLKSKADQLFDPRTW